MQPAFCGQWPPLPLPLGVSMDHKLFLQQYEYWPVPSKESINELHCSKRRNFVGYSDLAVEENHVSAAIHHEGPHEDIVLLLPLVLYKKILIVSAMM